MARRGEAWRRRLRLNQDRLVAERRRSGMFTSLSAGVNVYHLFLGESAAKRPIAYHCISLQMATIWGCRIHLDQTGATNLVVPKMTAMRNRPLRVERAMKQLMTLRAPKAGQTGSSKDPNPHKISIYVFLMGCKSFATSAWWLWSYMYTRRKVSMDQLIPFGQVWFLMFALNSKCVTTNWRTKIWSETQPILTPLLFKPYAGAVGCGDDAGNEQQCWLLQRGLLLVQVRSKEIVKGKGTIYASYSLIWRNTKFTQVLGENWSIECIVLDFPVLKECFASIYI